MKRTIARITRNIKNLYLFIKFAIKCTRTTLFAPSGAKFELDCNTPNRRRVNRFEFLLDEYRILWLISFGNIN